MGYDLYNAKGEHFRWHAGLWLAVLDLAKRHGWEPKGTMLSRSWRKRRVKEAYGNSLPRAKRLQLMKEMMKAWTKDYDSNDGQTVTTIDVQTLAAALEEALRRLSGDELEDLKWEWVYRFVSDFAEANQYEVSEIKLATYLYTDRLDERIREFLVFCRGGAFEIW
jgi:hypothetical protein